MTPSVTVTITLKGIGSLSREVEHLVTGATEGPLFKQWGARYRSFAQERFNEFSRGRGDWPDLAESTKKRRRRGKGKRRVSILRDTNTMYTALNPTFSDAPGAFQVGIPGGIVVGYGGPARHPSSDKLTVAELADVHNRGLGNVPQRKIIVAPPSEVVEAMKSDLLRVIKAAHGK